MADVVLGIGASHSPQVSTPWEFWPKMRQTDEAGPLVPPDMDLLLQPQTLQAHFERVQAAVERLSSVLRAAAPLDAIVIFGDDQHEQFDEDNMPAIAVYTGASCSVLEPRRAHIPWNGTAEERAQLSSLMQKTKTEYPCSNALATYLVDALTEQSFDLTRLAKLNERGLGHAFAFLYQRLWPECDVPIVPVMLNTYYPPNQPTPARSYALGRAVRDAIVAWEAGKRVAVLASGGLSHIVLEEALDCQVLDGLREHDAAKYTAIPRAKLRGGTSEILNWIALGGAVGDMPMTLIDYAAGYRSLPTTGCGMAFAYWEPARG
jgi:3-O-methylgallate 3,4-dioxygenase